MSPIPTERHAWADKLREVTQAITGYKLTLTHPAGKPFYNGVYNYIQDDKNVFLPLWGITLGVVLQKLGTEVFRENFDRDTWVKALMSTSGKDCLERGHVLIVPDVRFPNEANTIIENGGIVIRLEGDLLGVRKNSKRDLNHESEIALDNYDKFTKVIYNDKPGDDVFGPEILKIIDMLKR